MEDLFKRYKIRPLKRLGQNFLIDRGVIKMVIRAANLKPEDTALEIGPGTGVLTRELAKKVKKVVAIEKDRRMVEILAEVVKDFKNVEIVQGDILKLEPKTYNLKPKTYKVVANLPFYLTAPVIRKFLESIEVKPQQLILIVQKEVGQRICANPPDMSILAVSVQFYAKPEIIDYVSKKSFWPTPKVDSAIIKITPDKERRAGLRQFFRIVKAGFSQPRKQLINNLSKKLKIERKNVQNWLLKNNIQPIQRAETLTIEDWINLSKSCRIN